MAAWPTERIGKLSNEELDSLRKNAERLGHARLSNYAEKNKPAESLSVLKKRAVSSVTTGSMFPSFTLYAQGSWELFVTKTGQFGLELGLSRRNTQQMQ